MKIVNLSDRNGNVIKKNIGFSIPYLFFGPFYLLSKLHFFRGIIILMIYFYLLPLPGMGFLTRLFKNIFNDNFYDIFSKLTMFFRGEYPKFVGITLVIIFQIIFSFYVESIILKRKIKRKQLLPITENDARILIASHACNTKINLASSRIYSNENEYIKDDLDIPYIKNNNKSKIQSFKKASLKTELTNLKQLYNLNQMTREEYETRRAIIIRNYK